MIRRDGDCLRIDGPVTLSRVAELTREGSTLVDASVRSIDLSGVSEADSGALAMVLEWMRVSAARGGSLRVVRLGAGMESLAALYGLTEIFGAEG